MSETDRQLFWDRIRELLPHDERFDKVPTKVPAEGTMSWNFVLAVMAIVGNAYELEVNVYKFKYEAEHRLVESLEGVIAATAKYRAQS